MQEGDDFINTISLILQKSDRDKQYLAAACSIFDLAHVVVAQSLYEIGRDDSPLNAEDIEAMIASEDEKAQSTARLAVFTHRLHEGIEQSRAEGPATADWYARGVLQGVGIGFGTTDSATKLTGLVMRAGNARTGAVTGGEESGKSRRAWWGAARQKFDQLLAEDPDVRKMTPMEIATLVQKPRIPGSSDGVLQAKIKTWLKE